MSHRTTNCRLVKLSTAIRRCRRYPNSCFRPASWVGTGNGKCFVVRRSHVTPELPMHVAFLMGRFQVLGLAALRREELLYQTGVRV